MRWYVGAAAICGLVLGYLIGLAVLQRPGIVMVNLRITKEFSEQAIIKSPQGGTIRVEPKGLGFEIGTHPTGVNTGGMAIAWWDVLPTGEIKLITGQEGKK